MDHERDQKHYRSPWIYSKSCIPILVLSEPPGPSLWRAAAEGELYLPSLWSAAAEGGCIYLV